jgi:amino acid adenylation domain-containing protein
MPGPSPSPSDLPVKSPLAESDLRRFTAWNTTEEAYPRGTFVPQLVAAQAAVNPHRVALVAYDEVLTYFRLDALSNQVAHYLQSLGVGRDTLVGICLKRSMNLVVGALGIMKAGGTYLPLDPSYPPDRLVFLLNDAQAPVLLTEQHLAKQLPAGKWRVVNLDADEPQVSLQSSNWPNIGVSGESLAYVMYTSGSTGRPKGVEITHDSLLNLVFWHQRTFGVKPSDRASQVASPGFDAAVWELWPYLTAGASVYIAGDTVRSEPESLRNWLVRERITIAFVPTPLAERIMTLEWPPETALRVLLTGADTLRTYPPPNLPFRLINNYGPTECTVVASSGLVLPDERPDALPSIGRPIANTEIYILNEQMQQVPIGVGGEIYIGGAGLARGYLNHPELTAERFVPNPLSSAHHGRLYKTGDLGRYLPDGQIAFLGRIDEQIKIRGYRIEPNEVVTALNEHPTVLASAVVAREDAGGDKYVVAYVVVSPDSPITAAALQDFLRQRLPGYMVPSIFVRLESLPLTSNGKIDRASLPAPSARNTIADSAHLAPLTAVERRLVGILAKLLDIDQVGVAENFFLLGGHSLLGTQLITQVRDAFGVELRLHALFEAPTVAELSAEIDRLLLEKVQAMSEDEAERILGGNAGSKVVDL